MTAKLYWGAAMLIGLGIAASTHPSLAATKRSQTQGPFSVQSPADDDPADYPVPPIPPDEPPEYSAAPVPGATPAPTQESGRTGPQLAPGFFSQGSYGTDNGFLTGSTSQSELQRRPPPAGLRLNVPIQ